MWLRVQARSTAVLGVSILAWLVTGADAQVHVGVTACQPLESHFVLQLSFASLPATTLPVCRIDVVPSDATSPPLHCGTPVDWTCAPGNFTTFLYANGVEAC